MAAAHWEDGRQGEGGQKCRTFLIQQQFSITAQGCQARACLPLQRWWTSVGESTPNLISDAQEIREQQEIWPLPSPKLWDFYFNPQRLQELSPIAIAQGYKPQVVGLCSFIPWLPPALQRTHIAALTCKVLPVTLYCMGTSGDGALPGTVSTLL